MGNSAELTTPEQHLSELFRRYPDLIPCSKDIRDAYIAISTSFHSRGKMLVCGNGGSAADSEHVVGELMKSFRFKRSVNDLFKQRYADVNGCPPPAYVEGALPAISLVSQSALITAFSNDENPQGIFAQQVYGYGHPGDVLLAISTSGNSENVVEAVRVARALEMKTVGLTGCADSELLRLADICIRVPKTVVSEIQELHLPIYHALCSALEAEFFLGRDK